MSTQEKFCGNGLFMIQVLKKFKGDYMAMKTRKKFIRYINEMGNLGLLNYEEHKKIKEKIQTHPYLR